MRLRFLFIFGLVIVSGCTSIAVETEATPAADSSASRVETTGSADRRIVTSPQATLTESSANSVPDTINLVLMADLRNTTQIDVCRLDCASYTPFLTIDDAELIAALVGSLDSDLPLRPHARCPAVYQLRFTLANGQDHYFGYTCEMMSPALLRGSQAFWHGQDVVAPDAFNKLVLPFIDAQPTD